MMQHGTCGCQGSPLPPVPLTGSSHSSCAYMLQDAVQLVLCRPGVERLRQGAQALGCPCSLGATPLQPTAVSDAALRLSDCMGQHEARSAWSSCPTPCGLQSTGRAAEGLSLPTWSLGGWLVPGRLTQGSAGGLRDQMTEPEQVGGVTCPAQKPLCHLSNRCGCLLPGSDPHGQAPTDGKLQHIQALACLLLTQDCQGLAGAQRGSQAGLAGLCQL